MLKTLTRHRKTIAAQFCCQISTGTRQPGLFGISKLREPEDWFKLAEEAVARCNAKIEDVALTQPSVETIRQLDEISDTVCQVYDAAELCRNVHVNASWTQAAQQTCINLGGYVHELNNNKGLYDALVQALDRHDRLHSHSHASTSSAHGGQSAAHAPLPLEGYTREALLVGKLLKRDFEKAGIHLDDRHRQEVAELTARIHQTGFQITANIASHSDQLGSSRLPPHQVLRHVSSEELRAKAYKHLMRSPAENVGLLRRLAEDRDRLAHLLGAQSYGHYALDAATLAGKPEAVVAFMDTLNAALKPQMEEELQQLIKMKAHLSHGGSGPTAGLKPWDKEFCRREAKQDIDALLESARGHFHIRGILTGLQQILQRTFGVTVAQQTLAPGEAWAGHIVKLSLTHEDDGPLGCIYLDLWRRPQKFLGCAHFTLRCKRRLADGSFQLPLVALVFNFGSELLDLSEAETFFHEFGHALHSLLSRTEFQHLSGTRGPLDMIEIPSHLFEHFFRSEECVKLCSSHHVTGEALPDKVREAFRRHWDFMPALKMNESIVNAMIDQQFHGKQNQAASNQSLGISHVVEQYSVLSSPADPSIHHHLRFGHLVTYGASYYSYVYAKYIADAIWQQQFEGDPFSRRAGAHVRAKLLDLGGAKEPKALVEGLLGPGSLQHICGGWAPNVSSPQLRIQN